MSESGSYEASAMPGGLDVEVERLRAQALLAWEKESRTLRGFGLHDGMSVLEIGPGPGFITEQLLALVPNGTVTAVEIDPVLIERARNYMKGKGDERLRIVQGSIMESGLPANSFDFAYARLVFQHLPDRVGTASEVLRLLKPGGKLVVTDIDDDAHVFEPAAEPEVEAVMARLRQDLEAKGGDRRVSRKLPRILKEAGFTNVDIEVVVMHSDVHGLNVVLPRPPEDSWRWDFEAGRISEAEMHMMTEADRRFYDSDPIVMLSMFMVCGEKPSTGAG